MCRPKRENIIRNMAKVVYKVGDNVSTDVIYPERYTSAILPAGTAPFAFADDPVFSAKLKARELAPGSILLAGQNFGCAASREQAASCLKGHALVIVAKSFARLFLQNAINLGLRIVVCPTIQAEEGDDLEITPSAVVNKITAKRFPILMLPEWQQAIIDAGGLIPYTRARQLDGAAGESLAKRLKRSFKDLTARIVV